MQHATTPSLNLQRQAGSSFTSRQRKSRTAPSIQAVASIGWAARTSDPRDDGGSTAVRSLDGSMKRITGECMQAANLTCFLCWNPLVSSAAPWVARPAFMNPRVRLGTSFHF